ncbi:glycoprotein gp2 [Algibacter lectus]|uniref:cellulase n=1 Tax=Algibacter lectus TaxID=221126 RepID=A0A090WBN8_9FLAO|nr:glycoprotein gp2 [Algibacter lectus]
MNGRYRIKFDTPSETVSEGIGYGMLLSVYANDKELFDGLWLYYKDFSNNNGVMNWKISECSTLLVLTEHLMQN